MLREVCGGVPLWALNPLLFSRGFSHLLLIKDLVFGGMKMALGPHGGAGCRWDWTDIGQSRLPHEGVKPGWWETSVSCTELEKR